MRLFDLLGLAAQAEGLRVRQNAAGVARSAVWSVAAGLFALAALTMFHVAGWMALAQRYDPLLASLGVAMADLVLMALMLLLARKRRDPVAESALQIRQQALAEARQTTPLRMAGSLLGSSVPMALLGSVLAEGVSRAISRR